MTHHLSLLTQNYPNLLSVDYCWFRGAVSAQLLRYTNKDFSRGGGGCTAEE